MSDLGAFLAAIRERSGDGAVVEDPDRRAAHEVDWTRRWHGTTPAVVRPRSVDDVAHLVATARRTGVGLISQGGNTGLVGGAVPEGQIVVDLRGLDELGPVDRVAAQVTVGAGATLARVQAHVAAEDLEVAVDLGARDTATIGGMVATNAGGLHVLRHGPMRAQVVGAEAVAGTGAVVRANLAGLLKDNTGYDLPGLLCGSEGTLAVVTAARLRLVPRPDHRAVALLGLADLAATVTALPALRALATVRAVEVMRRADLDVVAAHLGRSVPLAPVPPVVVLVEAAGPSGAVDGDLAAATALASADVVATDGPSVAELWRWREAHPEAIAALGVVHKADVTLPARSLTAFVERVDPATAAAGASTTFVYGHLGDGNLHVNLVGPAADDDRAVDAVLELVLEHGGSVSAEHGIGRAKRRWLERQRGEAAVALMRATKAAWDPDGVLNPGVLL